MRNYGNNIVIIIVAGADIEYYTLTFTISLLDYLGLVGMIKHGISRSSCVSRLTAKNT